MRTKIALSAASRLMNSSLMGRVSFRQSAPQRVPFSNKQLDCLLCLANERAAMNTAVMLVPATQTGKAACLNRECVQYAQDFFGRHAVTSNSMSFLRMKGISRITLALR